MTRPYSLELKYLVHEALDSAEQLDEELNSLHLLFALFMLETSGGMLLSEAGLAEDVLLPCVDRQIPEPPDASEELMEFAEETAVKYTSREVNCLHLLVAMCRHRKSWAYQVLRGSGTSIPKLRARAISLLVNGMPRRYAEIFSSLKKAQPQPGQHATTATAARSAEALPAVEATSRNAAKAQPGKSAATRKSVVTSTYPVLSEVCIDLVALAAAGEIEPVIGRQREMEELADVLNKRKANNPLIIGPPGVGKTAVVEGLAYLLAHHPEQLPGLEGRGIFQLEISRLLKGTQLRGSFSDRIDALRAEVRSAAGSVVLFIDEIHSIAQGSVDGAQEVAQELKASLSRGDFPCIGATTTEEYQKTIERDPALSRRFQLMELEEPSDEETIMILASVADSYERHHSVRFDAHALALAVRLSSRYMRDRHQPDKSLTILDLAGSRARRAGADEVDERTVAEVVSRLTAVPVEQLVVDESERYLKLGERLSGRIVGHREVLERISEALRRNAAGFGGERPMGSFLFVGPTGVGKTEVARALAEELFGQRDSMLRFDMSEFAEAHSVAKLIGSPPGYIGHQEGGSLTDAMRRHPFQLVLFDEIEKAHADVHQLLLQLLDDGRLTDSMGRTVDFSQAVIILTSNIGSRSFTGKGAIGFGDDQGREEALNKDVLAAVRRRFSPELFNRIDEKMVFSTLSEADVAAVARLLLERSSERLAKEREIRLSFDSEVPSALAAGGGYDIRYGARPMRRAIQRLIEGPLASRILKGEVRRGDSVKVSPGTKGVFRFTRKGGSKR